MRSSHRIRERHISFFVSGEALIPYLCRMKNGFLNALRSYYPVYRIFKNPFIGQTLQLADIQ